MFKAPHALDLGRRQWTRVMGDITLIGTWITGEEGDQPCMVLIPTGAEYSDHLVPCAVTLSNAWIFDEKIGDPRKAAGMAVSFAEAMGLGIDRRAVIRIASLIHDHLDDLVRMPPMPRFEKAHTVALAKITDNRTGESREDEIKEAI